MLKDQYKQAPTSIRLCFNDDLWKLQKLPLRRAWSLHASPSLPYSPVPLLQIPLLVSYPQRSSNLPPGLQALNGSRFNPPKAKKSASYADSTAMAPCGFKKMYQSGPKAHPALRLNTKLLLQIRLNSDHCVGPRYSAPTLRNIQPRPRSPDEQSQRNWLADSKTKLTNSRGCKLPKSNTLLFSWIKREKLASNLYFIRS